MVLWLLWRENCFAAQNSVSKGEAICMIFRFHVSVLCFCQEGEGIGFGSHANFSVESTAFCRKTVAKQHGWQAKVT